MEGLLGGRYRLGAVLGSGGMGDVYRAQDERLRRDVAVKVLRSGARPQEAERLRREAEYLAALHHPNLVAVLDAGADGDRAWFTMDLVEGHDLRHELEQHGPLPAAGVRHLLQGAAAALAALHDHGLVHRDLKPANLLLADDGEVKVADLGIAHLLLNDHLTTTGQVLGTVAYLSPEQVSGRFVGTASDIYSLGIVAMEALTGVVAFPGGMAESAAARLVRPPTIPEGVQGHWRSLLAAMTGLEPADRPSARQIADVVDLLPDLPTLRMPVQQADEAARATAEQPSGDAPTAVLPVLSPGIGRARPRRRLLLAGVSAAAAVVMAGGGLALLGTGAPAAAPANAATASAAPRHTTATHRARPATPTPTPVATHAVPPPTTPAASAPPAPAASSAVGGLGDHARRDLRHMLQRWEHDLRHAGVRVPGPGAG